jgi:stage II sporulation protein M
MKQLRPLLIFESILLLIGVVFGIVLVLSLPLHQEENLSNHLNHFFQTMIGNNEYSTKESFWDHSFHYLKIALAIALLGLSVIGVPVVLVILFAKGAMIGFTCGFLVSQMGGKGILVFLFSVLPQNLLVVPSMIILGASSIAFATFIVKNRILRYNGKLRPMLVSFAVITLGLISILFIASIYESFLAPVLMEKSLSLIYG